MIRVKCTANNDRIEEIEITGDFFIYPEDGLWIIEEGLRNTRLDKGEIKKTLSMIIDQHNIELIGSKIEDFIEAIYCACSGVCGD